MHLRAISLPPHSIPIAKLPYQKKRKGGLSEKGSFLENRHRQIPPKRGINKATSVSKGAISCHDSFCLPQQQTTPQNIHSFRLGEMED
ncbi:hypothetical protein JTE90_023778 [Oedothorax gibbosus]|uniref:Uncharacterized protein n=1 Tax=Oedothorax gibbosus TaxID=931172 RepID=A0AAV6URZ2_9ARAC|nr:hypothetical protein JTE90_023778 [Oedothorax gibbosus]